MAEEEDRAKRRKIVANGGPPSDTCLLPKDCIRVHLVSSRQEFENGNAAFYPEFAEDHFGKEGKIYGYKGLKVDIWFHAASFHAFAQVKYDSQDPSHDHYEDVWAQLKDLFGENLVESRDFLRRLPEYASEFGDMLQKKGEPLARWELNDGSSTVGEIFRFEVADACSWVKRINPLILMSIEGATAIDVEDGQWEVYVAVATSGGVCKVTGYCAVYRFFHYPESIRMRISQILVLPPYQKKRYGLRLLSIINDVTRSRNVYDVTMEEPSEALQELRMCMDCIRLLNSFLVSSPVSSAIARIASEGASPSPKVLLPPAELVSTVRTQLKMHSKEFKQCWELLLFLHLDPSSRGKFWEAMVAKLFFDLFDRDKNAAASKRVVEVAGEFDDQAKAFLMMRFRGLVDGEEGEAEGASVEGLQEIIKERQEQLSRLARRVAAICKVDSSIPVSFKPEAFLE